MGNVVQASTASRPTVTPVAPPPPTFDDTKIPESPSVLGESTKSTNPGTIEDLHRKCKDLFPTAFEGARIIVNKGLSNHFQICHTINMSSITPAGYRFAATYVGTNHIGPGEAYPVLLGDIDPNGNVNANVIHQIGDRTKAKVVCSIQESRCVATQATADYKGDNFTTSFTMANLDVLNMSGVSVIHYLQSVTPTIDLGAEYVYQQAPQIPGGGMSVVSLAARYKSAENYVLSGTFGVGRANVCYYHKGMDTLQVGVEVETDVMRGESSATFGYQLEIPKANATFRGSVDSNFQVSGVLEKRLHPMPFTLMMSGSVLHGKSPQYRFGLGLLVG